MHLPARLRSAARSDNGASLVETLVAVVILGIAAVAILAGLQLSVTASDIHRKQTSDGANVRSFAEKIEQHLNTTGNYVKCAAANTYRNAISFNLPGHDVQQAAAVPLNGDGTEATSGTCPTRDQGVQRLRLTVSSADGRSTETLTLVVRRSCETGTACD